MNSIEHFYNLPTEKQKAIMTASFACFGKNGYKKTAMSEIAATAEVSKAALFHYFGSKWELYTYLFRLSRDEILRHMGEGTEDFFESIALATRVKLETMERHPGMLEFLSSLVQEDDSLIAKLRGNSMQEIAQGLGQLFAKVDWSRLRSGVSVAQARSLVAWVSDGYVKAFAEKKDARTMAKELDGYLKLIRQAIYKEEYL